MPQLQSPCSKACEPQLLNPHTPQSPHIVNREYPHLPQLEKAHAEQGRAPYTSAKTQGSQKTPPKSQYIIEQMNDPDFIEVKDVCS